MWESMLSIGIMMLPQEDNDNTSGNVTIVRGTQIHENHQMRCALFDDIIVLAALMSTDT